jgi:16S rRNA (adenine1518-N6/adenine1519-N6)-dimethyltransferase
MSFIQRPIKRFGQNFLIDKNIIRKIVSCVGLEEDDIVLEIGPGRGGLTFELADRCGKVLAVELDKKLCSALKAASVDKKNIDIQCADILKFDLKKYAASKHVKSFKVIANIPYYITTPIIEYLFKNIALVSDIFIMVQKEVAQRIKAKPGTKAYGSFTCFVNYYAKPDILFDIKSGSFWPKPKVESSFLHIKPYKGKGRQVFVKSADLFFKILRAAFGQRRKTLLSSLSKVIGKDILLASVLKEVLSKRPEDIGLAEFASISNQTFDFLKAQ